MGSRFGTLKKPRIHMARLGRLEDVGSNLGHSKFKPTKVTDMEKNDMFFSKLPSGSNFQRIPDSCLFNDALGQVSPKPLSPSIF